ncbi:helix-turn-helix domain-containing protein [[Kitasatospora] papulosa]|uniref:helix-turn-helix domain-containing protein n=1 Tax=[Kitasatospora] papulosa TaxID=1464011 RepID=UPI0036966F06
MRYGQGGGLTSEQRRARERTRLVAAQRFAEGATSAAVAAELRVSPRSVQRWRRRWADGGSRALVSQGPGSLPRLSEDQFRLLEKELSRGATAYGWPDERWTLDRVRIVIEVRFNRTYTVQGVAKLLRRHGRCFQMPAQQTMERGRTDVWASSNLRPYR